MSSLRSGSGEGNPLDLGGTVSRQTHKHSAVKPIVLLGAQCRITADQVPGAGVGLAGIGPAEFIAEVCFDMVEELPATVVVCASGRVIQGDGVVLE